MYLDLFWEEIVSVKKLHLRLPMLARDHVYGNWRYSVQDCTGVRINNLCEKSSTSKSA